MQSTDTLDRLHELRAALGEALTYVEVHIALAASPITRDAPFNPNAPVLLEVDAKRAEMQKVH